MINRNDWENNAVLQRGRLSEQAYFLSFSDDHSALTYERGNYQGGRKGIKYFSSIGDKFSKKRWETYE
ncbi:hypothetical protein [Neobacillus vireti]|uniref:hypothetical protein n=1 Tax=Neobacillus vireti TaxID=220686 RepID=UPI002FFEB59F